MEATGEPRFEAGGVANFRWALLSCSRRLPPPIKGLGSELVEMQRIEPPQAKLLVQNILSWVACEPLADRQFLLLFEFSSFSGGVDLHGPLIARDGLDGSLVDDEQFHEVLDRFNSLVVLQSTPLDSGVDSFSPGLQAHVFQEAAQVERKINRAYPFFLELLVDFAGPLDIKPEEFVGRSVGIEIFELVEGQIAPRLGLAQVKEALDLIAGHLDPVLQEHRMELLHVDLPRAIIVYLLEDVYDLLILLELILGLEIVGLRGLVVAFLQPVDGIKAI